MKRILTAAAAVAGAACAATLLAPAASAKEPIQQIPSDAILLFTFRFDHNLGAAFQGTGIPKQLAASDMTLSVQPSETLNSSNWALNDASSRAAATPNGCADYGILLGSDDLYFATRAC